MKRLMKASFYKMLHDRALWICLGGTVLWTLLTATMLSWIADGQVDFADPLAVMKYWRDLVSYHCINVPLLIGMVLLFSAEYKDGSWKLMIAKGIPQMGYFFAKLLGSLILMVLISVCALLTGEIYGVWALGMPFDAAVAVSLLKFTTGQCIAHGTVTILCFTILFAERNGEAASCTSMLLMVLGTMALSKMQNALGWGDALTGSWAFGQFEYVLFGGEGAWLRLLLVFAAYLVICGAAAWIMTRRDVE